MLVPTLQKIWSKFWSLSLWAAIWMLYSRLFNNVKLVELKLKATFIVLKGILISNTILPDSKPIGFKFWGSSRFMPKLMFGLEFGSHPIKFHPVNVLHIFLPSETNFQLQSDSIAFQSSGLWLGFCIMGFSDIGGIESFPFCYFLLLEN